MTERARIVTQAGGTQATKQIWDKCQGLHSKLHRSYESWNTSAKAARVSLSFNSTAAKVKYSPHITFCLRDMAEIFFPSPSWAQPLIKFQEVSKGTDREKAKVTQPWSQNTSLLRRGLKDNKLGQRGAHITPGLRTVLEKYEKSRRFLNNCKNDTNQNMVAGRQDARGSSNNCKIVLKVACLSW